MINKSLVYLGTVMPEDMGLWQIFKYEMFGFRDKPVGYSDKEVLS